MRRARLLLLFLLASSQTVAAKTAPAATGAAPAVSAVIECRKIADAAQRLACFDKAVDAMAQAESSGDLMTVDREQRRAVRRQAFGLNLPSLDIFNRGEKAEEVERLEATVTGARRQSDGKWTVVLDGGAVWRQTDDQELFKEPHPGSKAEIKKGVLGGYFMKIDGDTAFRARRDS